MRIDSARCIASWHKIQSIDKCDPVDTSLQAHQQTGGSGLCTFTREGVSNNLAQGRGRKRVFTHIAGDARQRCELVAGRHRLCLRELIQEGRLPHAGKADHRHAPVSAPGYVEPLEACSWFCTT